jgi:hypothetical protein
MTLPRPPRSLAATLLLLVAACGRDVPAPVQSPAAPVPGPRPLTEIVDSVRDPETEAELLKFQASATPVDTFVGAEPSRDALVQRYLAALETRDTATLRRMLVTRDEFAFLYYPTTPQGFPPYRLEAGFMWELLQKGNRGGLTKALRERGGAPLGVSGYECDPVPSREGKNEVWGPCVVLRKPREGEQGDPVRERLFAQVIQRDGRWKFLNYANKLD